MATLKNASLEHCTDLTPRWQTDLLYMYMQLNFVDNLTMDSESNLFVLFQALLSH